MKTILKMAMTWISILALPSSAYANIIIDQNNPVSSGGFCNISVGGLCGQSFQQDQSNITGAGVFINPNYSSGSGTVTISIYTAYSNAPSGLVASGTSSIVNASSGWVDVFWAPEAVSAATTYFLVVESAQPLAVSYSPFGAYADGNALYGGSTSNYAVYDLTFRTYYDDTPTANVPEPETILLMGIALVGLGIGQTNSRIGRNCRASS